MTVFGVTLPLPAWAAVPAYLVLLLLACLVVSKAIQWLLRRWARLTRSSLDDELAGAVHGPLVFALFIGGLDLGLAAISLPPRAEQIGEQVLRLGLIALLAFLGLRVISLALAEWGRRVEGARAVAGPARATGRIVVVAVAAAMAADAVGVSVAPLLTTLGIGSLAVALALQDTLANYFSGLYLLADKPVRVGDYVRLDSGQEGHVSSIGWRSTRIMQLTNNVVVVPNQKLAQAIVTNFHLPEPRMALPIRVGVAYDSDPVLVERVLLDVAAETVASGAAPGLRTDPAPAVRLNPGFGDSSLDYTLIVHIDDFETQFLVMHELRMRIVAALRAAGVGIALPQRVVHLPDGRPRDGAIRSGS